MVCEEKVVGLEVGVFVRPPSGFNKQNRRKSGEITISINRFHYE